VKESFAILKKYLPSSTFSKLYKYVNSDPRTVHYHVNWQGVKNKIDKISSRNLKACAQELITLLQDVPLSEKYVKTFHIGNNSDPFKHKEPTLLNTTQMIYHFLTSIYQRNVLASLIKYILLHAILKVFATSELLPEKKGIFFLMHYRLNEIIFECDLTAFNGSNYDNYLLCNSLIVIQTKINQKIKIFKKGSSLSTILLIHKNNLVRYNNILSKDTELKRKPIKNNQWLQKLYIKDIRDLVAANMSLDKIGKLFNLETSKLCFPYEKAVSIKALKTMNSLEPTNDEFWKDTFSDRKILLDERLQAQQLFEKLNFCNLYDYSVYYLKQDCVLLHSILLTLFEAYLKDSINIYLRRNFSQSSLAYEQFFIIEPSRQIEKLLAPRQIKNSVYNYLIRQSVTGGLCTSFVHGKIDRNTIINEHFNIINQPSNFDSCVWPNFSNLKEWKHQFKETPSGIATIDIRSLYPSAALEKLPVNIPLFYSRFTKEDINFFDKNYLPYAHCLNLNLFCNTVQNFGNHQSDIFKLISKPPRFYNEFHALNAYLKSLPSNIQIIRFQSYFTALGQLVFETFPVDGFLTYKDLTTNRIHFQILQYQSVYYHGHKVTCYIKNNEQQQKLVTRSNDVKRAILTLCQHFTSHFKDFLVPFIFDYIEISDCDFENHYIEKSKKFLFAYQKSYTYSTFLHSIYSNKVTGFLVVKNLKIKEKNQNPIFGFILKKMEYDASVLSKYTQNLLTDFKSSTRVIGLHECNGFMVISTEYFNWLKFTFDFENTPDIMHALLFQTDDYLKQSLESKLAVRKELKHLIKHELNPHVKQNYEIKAELIKLMLNSCYGYTLCNTSSEKFKQLENRKNLPKKTNNIRTCFYFQQKIYLCEKKKNIPEPFQTLLGHVGSYILYNSKIILIKRLYFLLRYLNPKLAQLLYMDTDSAHFLLKHPKFSDNVDPEFQEEFTASFNTHFESGGQLSGIWVEEGFFTNAEYLGEKCYRLYNEDNDYYVTHMKGLNANFQKQYHLQNIDPTKFPCIAFNRFVKSSDFILFKTNMSKNLFTNFIPNKRYFILSNGSIPLSI